MWSWLRAELDEGLDLHSTPCLWHLCHVLCLCRLRCLDLLGSLLPWLGELGAGRSLSWTVSVQIIPSLTCAGGLAGVGSRVQRPREPTPGGSAVCLSCQNSAMRSFGRSGALSTARACSAARGVSVSNLCWILLRLFSLVVLFFLALVALMHSSSSAGSNSEHGRHVLYFRGTSTSCRLLSGSSGASHPLH